MENFNCNKKCETFADMTVDSLMQCRDYVDQQIAQ
jgi:hypothetical protein